MHLGQAFPNPVESDWLVPHHVLIPYSKFPPIMALLLHTTKLWQGYVFTPVCDSVHGGSICLGGVSVKGGLCPWGVPAEGGLCQGDPLYSYM